MRVCPIRCLTKFHSSFTNLSFRSVVMYRTFTNFAYGISFTLRLALK